MYWKIRPVAAVTALAVSTAILAGCTAAGDAGDDAEASSLTLALSADFAGWEPASMIGAGPPIWIEQAVYDRLFNCDATGTLEPNIAESWEFNEDNTALTVHLRPDMTFSDGTPVDAAAVKASIDRQVAEDGDTGRLGPAETTITDPLTAVITVPDPNPILSTWLCGAEGTIYSPAWLTAADYETPIGSGPYVYNADSSTPGTEYVFERNAENWNAEQFPNEELVVKVIADPTATINALKTGQIAGAMTTSSTEKEVKASGLSQLDLQGAWAGLLITDRAGSIVPALGDVNVRRAMNMVFDRQAYAESLYGGLATPTSQQFRPGSAAYIEDLGEPYPFDVDAAKKLMSEAGYADGFEVEIPFVAGFGWDKDLPVVIQQLGLLGITVKQTTLTGPNAIADLIGGKFPLIFWPLGNSGNSLIDIENTVSPGGVWNVQHATDPTATDLLARIDIAGEEESALLQQELNQFVIDQAWFAPLVYPTQYFSYDGKLVEVGESSDVNALAPNLRDFG